MARLALTVQTTAACGYPVLPLTVNTADFVFTAAGADYADGFSFTHTGREILIVQNANVGAKTVTITSVANAKKRTGDITTYSVGASEFAIFGPFPKDGWTQSTGLLHGAASAADVNLAVVRLPAIT
jgi:hypothetical protein